MTPRPKSFPSCSGMAESAASQAVRLAFGKLKPSRIWSGWRRICGSAAMYLDLALPISGRVGYGLVSSSMSKANERVRFQQCWRGGFLDSSGTLQWVAINDCVGPQLKAHGIRSTVSPKRLKVGAETSGAAGLGTPFVMCITYGETEHAVRNMYKVLYDIYGATGPHPLHLGQAFTCFRSDLHSCSCSRRPSHSFQPCPPRIPQLPTPQKCPRPTFRLPYPFLSY
jgi:hypothetical protein